jgi:hypothetical protein
MSQLVCGGAQVMCHFGTAPATLNVLPSRRTMVAERPAASITDNVPFVNIPSFGMCASLANPQTAAATAAALGVLTPMPCAPVVPAPWVPGTAQLSVEGVPALTNTSQCHCAYGGVITVVVPGQMTVSTTP